MLYYKVLSFTFFLATVVLVPDRVGGTGVDAES